MLTREENELLTRVEGDAPMGRLMREHYWLPFALSAQLIADGAPFAARLLGKDYVAYRATDGRIGFMPERCPHRGASLLLARNEDNGLRCIFHGWKFDVSGRVLDVPSQFENPERFAASVPVRRHPVHEAGGMAWVWLGGGEAPPFPELPFAGAHDRHSWLTVSVADCNWLQGVEGTLDSVHVGTLHQSYISRGAKQRGGTIGLTLMGPPRYEVEPADYGMRAAALRAMQDGSTYVRVSEYFMPFLCLVGSQRDEDGALFIAVPIDDHHHLMFFGIYSMDATQRVESKITVTPGEPFDPFNFATIRGDRSNRWGQDRRLMEQGHFTGFASNILVEDIVVQVSMGPIVDRSDEYLCASDVAIVRARRLLLDALRDREAGKPPPGSARSAGPMRMRHPIDAVLKGGERWQDVKKPDVAA